MAIIKEILNPLYDFTQNKKISYIALGFFDGVHLGHQSLLNLCVSESLKAKAISTAVIFEPHPEIIINKLNNFFLLTPLEEKVEKIKKIGIDKIVIIKFDEKFQKCTPEEFLKEILIEKYNMRAVFVGYNYHFGYNKTGDTTLIKNLSSKYNYIPYILPATTINENEDISATIIKDYINKGQIEKANELLGYNYKITGKVISGDNRGNAILSIPTANIKANKGKLLPKNGIYISRIKIENSIYKGITNIGFVPTFKKTNDNMSIETFILNFNKNIYGQNITLAILKRIRNEIKFVNIDSLKKQIIKDIIVAEKYFNNV